MPQATTKVCIWKRCHFVLTEPWFFPKHRWKDQKNKVTAWTRFLISSNIYLILLKSKIPSRNKCILSSCKLLTILFIKKYHVKFRFWQRRALKEISSKVCISSRTCNMPFLILKTHGLSSLKIQSPDVLTKTEHTTPLACATTATTTTAEQSTPQIVNILIAWDMLKRCANPVMSRITNYKKLFQTFQNWLRNDSKPLLYKRDNLFKVIQIHYGL